MTYNWLFLHQAVWRWGPMRWLATHHVLQNGSILWELLKNVRGGGWRKPKHRHPTVVVVIFTCQILTESENNALIAINRLWSISSLISLIPRPSLISCSMQGEAVTTWSVASHVITLRSVLATKMRQALMENIKLTYCKQSKTWGRNGLGMRL